MKKEKEMKNRKETALPVSLFASPQGKQKGGLKMDYEDTLFASGFVHRVDLRFSEADWADLVKNPLNKTRYSEMS